MRATIFNCCASGEAKSPGTATPDKAVRSRASASIDCAAMRDISRSIRCSRGCVISWRNSAVQALEPYMSRVSSSMRVEPFTPTR